MNERAKQVQREYQRKWRQANRDKVRKYQERYWERKALASQPPTEGEQRGGDCI